MDIANVRDRNSVESELISTYGMPLLFIILWSSGYITGAVGLEYAEPFTMTFIRFGTASAILFLVAVILKAPWPKGMQLVHISIVGLLIQAIQFGGVYSGMSLGVSASVSALIIGMMPVLTALGAGLFLGESVSKKQWSGLLLGVLGVALVVSEGLNFSADDSLLSTNNLMGYLLVILGLLGITAGTLYQKKFCQGMDLRTGGAIQLAIAAVVMGVLATETETMQIEWTLGFISSTACLVFLNSIGAVSLMYLMLRRGKASTVASLFFLVPPVTAVMATLILGDDFSLMEMTGFVVTVSGVYLATHNASVQR